MIVLDTHAWFWWATESPQLSSVARSAIERSSSIGISSASALELARLSATGRLEFDDIDTWVKTALRMDPRISEIPINSTVALRAVDLLRRGLAGDPMDQVILATAELNSATLITRDRKLRAFAPSVTAW